MSIHRLRPDEIIRVDKSAILSMRQTIGPARADHVFELILHDVLEGLVASEEALSAGDAAALALASERVRRQAERLALHNLADQALAVRDLCRTPQARSLPAVVHRMIRTGEGCVSSIWQVLSWQARP